MNNLPTLSLFVFLSLVLGCADGALEVPEDDPSQSVDGPPEPSGPKEDHPRDPNCPDTSRLTTQGLSGFNATSRVTSMRVPMSRNQAIQYGCDLVAGSNGGIGLSVLIRALNVDLDTLFTPNSEGFITSVVLGHLRGWEPGQSGNETDNLELRLYSGEQAGDGRFNIGDGSYNPDGSVRVRWPAHLGCGELQTEPGILDFSIPSETSGVAVGLNLGAAQVSAQVSVGQRGFSMDSGTIVGYVPVGAIVSIVSGIQDGCNAPNPPEICTQAGNLLRGDPEQLTRDLVLPFLHGLDARLSPDQQSVESCSGNQCNAMSVCVRIEGEGTSIAQ